MYSPLKMITLFCHNFKEEICDAFVLPKISRDGLSCQLQPTCGKFDVPPLSLYDSWSTAVSFKAFLCAQAKNLKLVCFFRNGNVSRFQNPSLRFPVFV